MVEFCSIKYWEICQLILYASFLLLAVLFVYLLIWLFFFFTSFVCDRSGEIPGKFYLKISYDLLYVSQIEIPL